MKDFLEFLNTAEAESLQEISGIGPGLAGRIVAARPFETIEDSLRVSGLGDSLLQRLRDSFDEMETPPMREETDLVPSATSQPVRVEAPPDASQSARAPQPAKAPKSGPNFFQRLGRAFVGFLKFLFVLLIIAVILGGIGAGLYFGLPYLHQMYVVPVNQNTARIAEVADQQSRDTLALQTEIAALKTEIADLQTRDTEFETQLAAIEASIETHSAALNRLDEMQSKLDQAADQQREGLNAELSRQVKQTRIIELLSRARLYLSQSNFGQARQDVQLARDLLTDLRADSPAGEQASLDAALFRLDLVLGNLPGFPVVAVDDLNIAWNLLVLGVPGAATTP
jgi:hypothetical protein